MIMLKDETVKMKENSGDSFSDTNGKKWISVFFSSVPMFGRLWKPRQPTRSESFG